MAKKKKLEDFGPIYKKLSFLNSLFYSLVNISETPEVEIPTEQ